MIEGQTRYVKQIWDGNEWSEYHVYDEIDSSNLEYLENVILLSSRFGCRASDSSVFMKSLCNNR